MVGFATYFLFENETDRGRKGKAKQAPRSRHSSSERVATSTLVIPEVFLSGIQRLLAVSSS
jgi:hypothetical protein